MAGTDNGSIFTIKEVTGDKRVIILTGRALPYRPFELTTEQRVEETWLPGVPEATATVLGPKEASTTISGFWKDRYLGDKGTSETQATLANPSSPFLFNGATVDRVRLARDAVDAFTRAGQLLEVTWLDERRQGFLKKFTKKWHNVHDLEWSMEFTWISRGEGRKPAVFVSDVDMDTSMGNIKESNSLLRAIKLPNIPLNYNYLNAITDLANAIDGSIAALEDAMIQVVQRAFTAVNAIKGIVSLSTGIVDECKMMSTFIEASASDMISFSNAEDAKPNERFEAEIWRQEALQNLKAVQAAAVQAREAFMQAAATDIAGRYIARAGDDLRDVSRIFYNTPFEWRRIMIFNQLDTSELTAGQLVLVPTMNTQAAYGVND
jgi:hypothetical protein